MEMNVKRNGTNEGMGKKLISATKWFIIYFESVNIIYNWWSIDIYFNNMIMIYPLANHINTLIHIRIRTCGKEKKEPEMKRNRKRNGKRGNEKKRERENSHIE